MQLSFRARAIIPFPLRSNLLSNQRSLLAIQAQGNVWSIAMDPPFLPVFVFVWEVIAAKIHTPYGPVSQENLSPGNCATVFPYEIMLLTINVATVYPKVARKYCRSHARDR